MSDAEIGELLRKEPADVARGREAVLELLADALGVGGHDRRERVRQAVAALPDDAWRTRAGPPSPSPRTPPSPRRPPPPREEPARPVKPRPRPPEKDRDRAAVARELDDELTFEPEPRRSRRGGLLALLALVAVLGVVAALLLSGGDDDDDSNEGGSQPAPAQDGGPGPGETPDGRTARLSPLAGGRGEGRLQVTDEGATITIRELPNPSGSYQVWLYDSVVRAESLGTFADASGRLRVQLPANARSYRFLDVSLEPADANPNHSGDSVLRAPLRDLLRD